MIWAQALVCFFLWIGYGIVQSRRSAAIRSSVSRMSRSKRATSAGFLLVAGAAILFGGLVFIQLAGGLREGALTLWAWLIVAIVGLAFVHAQTMAAAMLVTMMQETVTGPDAPRPNSSSQKEEEQ